MWHTFNIPPSHFNLTSALEFEEIYKFVERKLKEDCEKKNYQKCETKSKQIFAYLIHKKKSNKTVSCLRKANEQIATCLTEEDC